MTEHLDSANLVPFKRHDDGYQLPDLLKEQEQQTIEELDPGLRPEEQGYVRHYLAYADILLRNTNGLELEPSEHAPAVSRGHKMTEIPASSGTGSPDLKNNAA